MGTDDQTMSYDYAGGFANRYSYASRNAPNVASHLAKVPSYPAQGTFPISRASNPQELKFAVEISCSTNADPEMFALHQRLDRLEQAKPEPTNVSLHCTGMNPLAVQMRAGTSYGHTTTVDPIPQLMDAGIDITLQRLQRLQQSKPDQSRLDMQLEASTMSSLGLHRKTTQPVPGRHTGAIENASTTQSKLDRAYTAAWE